MTFWGIAENLVSDVIIILIAIIASWVWITLTHRRKLQQFFNTLSTKRLIIYLSDINVLPFGATGSSGKKLSYQGHAVAYGEMQGASQIKNLFSFIIPKLAEASQTIGKIFLSDVIVQTVISPPEKNNLDLQASFIALGSSAYNVAAAHIEELNNGIARFQFGSMKLSELESAQSQHPPIAFSDTDPQTYPGTVDVKSPRPFTTLSGEMPPSGSSRFTYHSELIHMAMDAQRFENDKESAILIEGLPPITDTVYGFVERIVDTKGNRALFYVAGLSEFSTTASSYYLASQWLALYKKYGEDKSFIIMLRFVPSDLGKWSVVFERDLS